MKKIVKILKVNSAGFIFGTLFSIILGVSAATVLNGTDIQYTGNKVNNVNNIKQAIDKLYEKANGNKIKLINEIGKTIAIDNNDIRFIGANPNNYVSFNGENNKWRMIGYIDGRIKLVRNPIGNYSFDTSKNDVNNGFGVNAWNDADLMKLLNPGYENNSDLKCKTSVSVTNNVTNCGDNSASAYDTGLVNNSLWWNASSGSCYNNGNYQITACDFTSGGLKTDDARNMIDNATWYLGSNLKTANIWNGTTMNAAYLYNMERSNNSGKQCSSGDFCNDSTQHDLTWQGKVGLIYPSDYVYATSGGTTYDRDTCLTVNPGYVSDDSVQNWNNTYTDCKNNNWLLNTSMWTFTISPRAYSSYSYFMFYLHSNGFVYNTNAKNAGSVRPVVYLKPNISITGGEGTTTNPYTLG